MADGNDLFSRLFRKTQDNLKKRQAPPPPPVANPATPASGSRDSGSRTPGSGGKGSGSADVPHGSSAPGGVNQREKRIKIPLTNGKIDTYLSCPRKFAYSYIEKVQREFVASPHLSFDSSLHAALRAFYREKTPTAPFRLERLLELLGHNWDRRGFESMEQEQEYRLMAESGLRHYFEKYCQVPSRAAFVDHSFKIDLEGGLYSGKFDRVDRQPDDSLVLIDYKSGKPPQGGVYELETSLPVQLMFLAAEVMWPGKARQLRFIYLKDGTELSVLRQPAMLVSARQRYLAVGEAIYQGKFEPVRSNNCGWCDFQEICPVGRIPTLNMSRIRTFLECPHKFAEVYVRKTVRASFGDDDVSADLALDRPLHHALAALHRDFKPGINQDPKSFTLRHFFQAIPRELPGPVADQVKGQGQEILENYLDNLYPKAKTKTTNEFLTWLTDLFEFQTTIDRIDEDSDGKLELIDFKSGKRVKEAAELRLDPINWAIAAAAEEKWPGQIARLTHIYLRSGTAVSVMIDDFMRQRGHELLTEIGGKIRNKEFEALGGPACGRCPARSQCGEPALSVSLAKIQALRDCPKRYRLRYIDRAPVPEKEKPALVLAQALRNTLRDYVVHGRLLPDDQVQKAFTARLNADTTLSEESRTALLAPGATAIANFHAFLGGKMPNSRSLAENVRAMFDGMLLTAFFDRVDILPNGNLAIIIYKTGKRAPSKHELHLDLSGTFAYQIAQILWPGRVEGVTQEYLLTGDRVHFTPSTVDLETLKLALAEFREEIETGAFEGNRNPLCNYCDYLDQCEDATSLLLSPSKISCFQSCALKYKMKYIDRVPREPRPTPHLNFDRSIHFALREFHEMYEVGPSSEKVLLGLLNKYWINDGYADAEDEMRFKVRAQEMLKTYLASLTGRENPIMFETSARWRHGNIDVSVQIDRVDELPDGKLEIIDYKTGKKVPDPRVLHEDSTLLNMFMAANQRWLGRIGKVSYHFLSANQRLSLVPDEAAILAHTQKLEKLVEEIDGATFEAKKGALCAWCEYYGPCPEWKIKPHVMAGETPEVFRKRIRLSYSKMSLYLNCPRSYGKLYIEKVPPKPQPFFSFGTTIHETFENVYDPVNPLPRKPTLEEVLEIYDQVRLKYREGFKDEAEEERYRQDGIRQVTMYYNRFIAPVEFRPAFSIEDYFEIPCGKYAVMTGFIDRIDKLDDGTYEILDYKTEPTMRSQEAVDEDKQLSIYYWACEDTFGLKISKLSLLMLDHDVKVESTRNRDCVDKVIESVDATAYAMIHETEFKPKKNKYCKSCDHLHDCPLKDEILADDSLISMKKF